MTIIDNSALMAKLIEYTRSEKPGLRAAACRALGSFEGDEVVRNCLIECLSDPEPAVQEAAAVSLKQPAFAR